MAEITTAMLEGLPRSGPTDPIEYYRRPLVGWIFRRRINMGLGLLGDRRFASCLEVGYGAGAVLLALSPSVDDLHGIDLDADPEPVAAMLASRGERARLERADVCALPYEDGKFDLVVSFSVFEHLPNYRTALSEVGRVLSAGGRFLLGMPAVNRAMEAGFQAIGFKGIEDHHVTKPGQVAKSFRETGFRPLRSKNLHFPLPGMRLYFTWLLERLPAGGTHTSAG
jgi:SAM-dependent methyltransferase